MSEHVANTFGFTDYHNLIKLMKKSKYKEAMRTIRHANKHGVDKFSHPLSPDGDYMTRMCKLVKHMQEGGRRIRAER